MGVYVEASIDVVRMHHYAWNRASAQLRERAERRKSAPGERPCPEPSRVPRAGRDPHTTSRMHERREAEPVGVACIEEIVRPHGAPLEGRWDEAQDGPLEQVFEDASALAQTSQSLRSREARELVGVAGCPGKRPNRACVCAITTVNEPVCDELDSCPGARGLFDQSLGGFGLATALVGDQREVKSLGTRSAEEAQRAREASFERSADASPNAAPTATEALADRSIASRRDIVHEHPRRRGHALERIRCEVVVARTFPRAVEVRGRAVLRCD